MSDVHSKRGLGSIASCLPIVSALALAACGARAPSEPAELPGPAWHLAAPTPITPEVRSNWAGYKLGASPGSWHDRGQLQHASPGETAPRVTMDASLPNPPASKRNSFMMGNPKTGQLIEVEMNPADFELIAKYLEARGYANGTPDPAGTSESDEIVPKGWGGGTDERKPYGIHEYGVVSGSLHRIGQMTAGDGSDLCTGTLIGTPETSYYVITAAHCYWASGTGNYLDPNFRPRRDGCKRPDGTTISGCDTTPYGTWDGLGWLMPTYFVENCKGQSVLGSWCVAQDVAVQNIGRPSGEGFPGAMGFGYYERSTLEATHIYNKGYPNCLGSGDPTSNCRANTLYGDPNTCALGRLLEADGDGWGQMVEHGCDTSPGMSGSALYINSSGHKVWGIHSGGGCYSGCTKATPNAAKRITPWWYNAMLNFMGI